MNRITRNTIILVILASSFAVLGFSCGFLRPVGTGTLRVEITDKPFPFEFIEHATVTLTRVEVRSEQDVSTTQPASNPSDDEGSDSNSGGPFVTIFDDANGKEFDLITLHNGQTDLLAQADLPAGHYTQMHLVVTKGEVTLTDGRVFPLTVPSGEQSGIKLNFSFDVVAGQQIDLLLDVDLSRAFTPIPGGHIDDVTTIREFHFSPSIALRLITLLGSGNIAGLVTDTSSTPIAGAAVTAFSGDTEVTSTSTGDDGKYVLVGLAPGTYRLEFSADGFLDAQLENIAVSAGQTTQDVDTALETE